MANLELFENEYLSVKEASHLLGVSVATVNNWIKLGVIAGMSEAGKTLLLKATILELKTNISLGLSEKLKARANKKHTLKKRKHRELNEESVDVFFQYIDTIIDVYSVENILIALANKVVASIRQSFSDDEKVIPDWVLSLENELEDWAIEAKIGIDMGVEMPVNPSVLEISDLLGKTYQHLAASSSKAQGGVFYTPSSQANAIINQLQHAGDLVLDPCCGSGAFLIQALAYKMSNNEEDPLSTIFGVDIDPIAVRVCRLNLLMLARERFAGNLHIYTANFISDLNAVRALSFPAQFDLVITNPPWGADFSLSLLADAEIRQFASDSFAVFLALAVNQLCENGRLGFLLPESFVDVASHALIRKKLLKETSDIRITKLGKIFNGLLTNVVKVEACKVTPDNVAIVELLSHEKSVCVNQAQVLADPISAFIFNVGVPEANLLDKIFSHAHHLIGQGSSFALGIVTGNNAKLISPIKADGYEIIVRGKDVQPYQITESEQFIKFDRKSFQQCADESYFRVDEKLIYRFISNKLIFAYDNKRRLTLNSANIVIPNIGLPMKVVLAILQSKVANFVFKAKFNSIKILRKHIESIPIFIFDAATNQEIIRLVDEILSRDGSDTDLFDDKINQLIYQKLNLSADEIVTLLNFSD